jgi:hypothetical protein
MKINANIKASDPCEIQVIFLYGTLKAGCRARLIIPAYAKLFYAPSPLTANPLGPNPVADGVPAILAR